MSRMIKNPPVVLGMDRNMSTESGVCDDQESSQCSVESSPGHVLCDGIG